MKPKAGRQLFFYLILILIGFTAAFFTGESAVRAYYSVHFKDSSWLLSGIRKNKSKFFQEKVTYAWGYGKTWSVFDQCQNKMIHLTVNERGGRGGEWPIEKKPGSLRILALGESSTFGVNSSDPDTWPAVLEKLLQNQNRPIEILNGGRPATTLDILTGDLVNHYIELKPDVLLLYAGYNEGTHQGIADFHRTKIGKMLFPLYQRSTLYTYLVEKTYFLYERSDWGILPRLSEYEQKLDGFLAVLKENNIKPIVILQATEVPVDKSVRGVNLSDKKGLLSLMHSLIDNAPSKYNIVSRSRLYQTQIIQEALKLRAEKEGIPVIDPRPEIEKAEQSEEGIFCDEVHLSDKGNRVLAETIAPYLTKSALPFTVSASNKH